MSTDHATDPIEQFTHDHGHLGSLVQSVATTLSRRELSEAVIDELVHAAELLRDSLLSHFAREEEGLFPFIEANVPALSARVSQLLADHDAVIARATDLIRTMSKAEQAQVGHASCVAAYDRFVEVYAGHHQAEQSLLAACDAALDQAHRRELRGLLEAI